MSGQQVEEQGAAWALELFAPWVKPGTTILDTRRCRQRALAQRTFGDYIFTMTNDEILGWEVKAERKHTGNLFLETWSNLTRVAGHRRDGWLLTLQADVYVNIFLDVEVAYAMRLADLRRWAIEEGNVYSGKYAERLVDMSASGAQKNKTLGFVVPISHLAEAVNLRTFRRTRGEWLECLANRKSGASEAGAA